jgi:hypothetical protein
MSYGFGTLINVPRPSAATMATATAPTTAAQIQETAAGSGGLTRRGLDVMKGMLTDGWERRIHAIQAKLLTDFGDQLQDAAALWPIMNGMIAKMNVKRAQKSGFIDVMYPPGVIVELGVPFDPKDLGSDAQSTLKKTYTPNDEQKFFATWVVYEASQRSLAHELGKSLRSVPDVYLDLVDPNIGIQKIINDRGSKMSVNNALALRPLAGATGTRAGGPIFTTDAPGLLANPIEPTEEELNNPGGLAAYYARGGFLWDRRAFDGKLKVAHSDLHWGIGYFLADGVPAMAVDSASGEDDYGYDFFLTVRPGTYELRIAAVDADWYAEVGAAIVSLLKKLGGLICGLQQQFAQIAPALLADTCHDAMTGQPCVKGAPNCICVPAPPSAGLAVGVANIAISKACAPGSPPGPGPFLPPPNPQIVPPPPKPFKVTPTMIAIGVGILGAAVLFTRKKPA